MIKKTLILIFLLVTVYLFSAGFSYKWGKISFSLPVSFSQPDKAGVNAVMLGYPEGATVENELAFIILVRFSHEQLKEMNMDDKALLNYAKTVYFATAKPAESYKERIFFGKKVKGDIQTKKIPKKSKLEAYLITLPSGEKLAAGFTFYDKINIKATEEIVSIFAAALSEK